MTIGTAETPASPPQPDTLPTQPILAPIGAVRGFDLGHALQWAARSRNIWVGRLAFDIMRRQIGRQKLTTENYFHFGLHLARHSAATRATFLGDTATRRLNKALSDPNVVQIWRDKVSTTAALEKSGLPTPPIRAVFQRSGNRDGCTMLDSQANLAAYLGHTAVVPFFGKPVIGAAGIGAMCVVARDGPDRLVLADGRTVAVADLAHEIAQTYPQGYLFQDRLCQHPDLVAFAGEVMCSLRIFSVWVGGRFTPLYANMRLPSPGAMLDITCNGSAAIDLDTGQILRTQDGRRLGGHSLEKSHITGAQIIGVQLPFWPRVMQLAAQAHALFPSQGVLGIDIGLTENGATIVELNSSPGHGGHHQTNDEGILTARFRAVFAAALAERGITGRRARQLLP